jgi:hypothetical protein
MFAPRLDRSPRKPRPCLRRLGVEELEDRTVLATAKGALAALLPSLLHPVMVAPAVSTTGEIDGTVFNDLNGNRTRDAGEPGLPGVTVFLDLNNDNTLDPGDRSTTTDAQGHYSFTGLQPGSYTVAEVLPTGFIETAPPQVDPSLRFRADFSDPGGNPAAQGFTHSDLSPLGIPGFTDQWHLSNGRGSDPGHSGPNSFYFGAGEGPYGGGQYSQSGGGLLLSAPIDLTGVSGPVSLDFNQFLAIDESPNFGGTMGFAVVGIFANGQLTFVAGNESLGNYSAFKQYSDFSTGFQPVDVDISPFAGQVIQAGFVFLANQFFSPNEGWYVDDVSVHTPKLPGTNTVTVGAGSLITGLDFGDQQGGADLVATSLQVDPTTVNWGDKVQVHYTLKNQGTSDAGAFKVEVRLSSDTLIDAADTLLPSTPFSVPGLAAGASVSGTITVTLPGAPGQPPAGFTQPAQVLLSLRINADDAVPETDTSNDSNQGLGVDSVSLNILGVETEPNDTLTSANPIVLGIPVSGTIGTPGDRDFFSFQVYQSGRLMIRATPDAPSSLHTVLTLYGPEGELLANSAGSPSGSAPEIVQYVQPGNLQPASYSLAVSGTGATGAYQLTTDFLAASSPLTPIPIPAGDASNGIQPVGVVTGDFNGDGIPDLAISNSGGTVSVLLGVGDGSFRPEVRYPLGFTPTAIITGDFYGDGHQDLAVISGNSPGSVVLLRNRGDGRFELPQALTPPVPSPPSRFGSAPSAVVAGNFDHNPRGLPDLAVLLPDRVAVYLNQGNGVFSGPKFYATGPGATGLVAADLYGLGHGHLDLATRVSDSNQEYHLALLKGDDHGSFETLVTTIDLGGPPVGSLVAADLTGNGRMDLLSTEEQNDDLSKRGIHVLLNRGGGTFGETKFVSVGREVTQLVVADFDGDGRPDLAFLNQADSTDLNIFRGNGDGTFQAGQRFVVPFNPGALAADDFNGDGRPDLVVAGGGGTAVLLGRGDDTFQDATHVGTGQTPLHMVTGDFNGDGALDLLTANVQSHDFSLLLGLGDGTFLPERRIPFGGYATNIVAGDFNGDGRLDFAVIDGQGPIASDPLGQTLTVFLGVGDGTFRELPPLDLKPFGIFPVQLAAGRFGGSSEDELAVVGAAEAPDFKPKVYLSHLRGDGTISPPQTFDLGLPAHSYAVAVVTGDFNGDGLPGLAVASYQPSPTLGSVSVLLGRRRGTFAAPIVTPLAQQPQALAAGDFNSKNDNHLDLVMQSVAPDGNPSLTVLLGDGQGTFTVQAPDEVQAQPGFGAGIVVADFQRNGRPGVAFQGGDVNSGSAEVEVALGNGDGTLQTPVAFPVGDSPEESAGGISAILVGSFNGNGIPDLAVANSTPEDVSVLFGRGDGTFYNPSKNPPVNVQQTPIIQDLNGDGVPDEVIVNQAGQILFRAGQHSPLGNFAPPRVINPVNRPARAVTVVKDGQHYVLAAIDLVSQNAAQPTTDTISVYSLSGQLLDSLSAGGFATAIASADLNGDGLGDIVVANSLTDNLSIFLAKPGGGYAAPVQIAVGTAPGSLLLTDVRGVVGPSVTPAPPDIIVTNQLSGDVSVLLNDGHSNFTTEARYRAGGGPYDVTPRQSSDPLSLVVTSAEAPTSAVVGDFFGDGYPDLAIADSGSNTVAVLRGLPGGRFANPVTLPTGGHPIAVVTGDFTSNGHQDLAVLNQGSDDICVFLGDGHGNFTEKVARDASGRAVRLGAGNLPTGLAVRDVNGDGMLDLLVGNAFGDVLTLLGNGDGTFQPPAVTGSLAPLDVQAAGRGGQPEALVANQRGNQVNVQAATPGSRQFAPVVVLANGTQTGLAPGAVQWAKLDKSSPFFDAVVVASGSNSVLVYRGTGFDAAGNPTFAPAVGYPVGTDPAGVTIADVNGDGIPDMLVANQGSNDVSVLFGSFDANGDWVGTAGPRLKSGGQGPVATALRDVNGDGIPDLVVTNGQSGTMTVLPGVGQGFFNDQSPQVLTFPGNPALQAPSFFGASTAGVVAAGNGTLLGFDLAAFAGSVRTLFAPPAGEAVDAAEALPDGQVVVALEGGAVEQLGPSGAVDLQFDPLTGMPLSPSALAVLQGESGLKVLVTNAGGDRVFVFSIPNLPEQPRLPPPELPAGPAFEVTAPPDLPLTLLITVLAGPGPADVEPIPAPASPAVSVPSADQASADPSAQEGDATPRPGEGGIDVEEKLRGKDADPLAPDPKRDAPAWRGPADSARWDGALIALAHNGVPRRPAADLSRQPVADAAGAESGAAKEARAVDAAFVPPPNAAADDDGQPPAVADVFWPPSLGIDLAGAWWRAAEVVRGAPAPPSAGAAPVPSAWAWHGEPARLLALALAGWALQPWFDGAGGMPIWGCAQERRTGSARGAWPRDVVPL